MTCVHAVLSPPEISDLRSVDLGGTVCVVFDVLRATSSIVTGIAHGVHRIFPAETIEEAREIKATHPEALLGGERKGERIAGFDIGNSPAEYCELKGREIITTTTNGTFALRACERAKAILPGSLLNIGGLAATVAELAPENLLLVCAGTGRGFAMEDAIGAGALIERLPRSGLELSDAARAVLNLHRFYAGDLLSALSTSKNGRALARIGKTRDIEWCAQVSVYPEVGCMADGMITIHRG